MTTALKDNQKFEGTLSQGTAYGALANLKSVTAEITCSGASSSASNLIPAGAFVLGVTARVITAITGASAFTIGDGSDADKWGAGIALTAGTTTTGAAFTAGPSHYAAATSVVLTATTSSFTAGKVRVTVHYIDFTAATA